MGKYSRTTSTSDTKADEFISEIKSLNRNVERLMAYLEENEVAESLNEIADNTEAIKQVFQKVGRIEGGMGVVNSLIQGLKSHVKTKGETG